MTALKCTDCGVTYPSKYYFVDDGANEAVCSTCAALSPEQRERRRTTAVAASPSADLASSPGAGGAPAGGAQQASIHPLAVVSFCVGVLSIFLFPTRSIIAGVVAVGLGVAASYDIARGNGRRTGLRLARAGVILGCGMAGAWTLMIAVAWLADYLR